VTELLYRPGSWRAVVADEGVAVLPSAMHGELLGDIWRAIRTGNGLAAVLEALTGAFGTSLRSIPPFAVATFAGDEVRLAVRGPLGIVVQSAGDSFTVNGEDVTTWSERVVRSPEGLQFTTGEAPAAGADHYAIASGIVLCSGLSVSFGGADATREPIAPWAEATTMPTPEETIVPTSDEVIAPAPEETIVPAVQDEPTGGLPDDLSHTQVELPDDAYDHLWGATVVKSVENAAVRESDADDDGEPDEPTASPESVAAGPMPAVAESRPEAPAVDERPPSQWTEPPATGLIDRVPDFRGIGASSSSWPEPTPTSPAPLAAARADSPQDTAPDAPVADHADHHGTDHDGLTVTVSELEAMRRLAGAQAGAPAGAAGPTPTPARTGRVVLSTGETYPLDRPIIIGRRPRANRVQGDQVPLLVTVASPEQDISRNHLEVRVEGRHVLVVDLHTTNGSVLHREGTPPMRLSPGEPVLVLSADVVDLGDGVALTFEELP
jgi:hypothetical protein